jgi:hypothetical protein
MLRRHANRLLTALTRLYIAHIAPYRGLWVELEQYQRPNPETTKGPP